MWAERNRSVCGCNCAKKSRCSTSYLLLQCLPGKYLPRSSAGHALHSRLIRIVALVHYPHISHTRICETTKKEWNAGNASFMVGTDTTATIPKHQQNVLRSIICWAHQSNSFWPVIISSIEPSRFPSHSIKVHTKSLCTWTATVRDHCCFFVDCLRHNFVSLSMPSFCDKLRSKVKSKSIWFNWYSSHFFSSYGTTTKKLRNIRTEQLCWCC